MEPRFIADSMLGKLARWLRLMGFDTLYYPSISDEELIRRARRGKRVVLTKDSQLFACRKNDNIIYVNSSDPYEQIRLVVKSLNLDPWKRLFSRCVYCNEPVEKITDISGLKDKVPPHTLKNCSSFYRCPVCGKIYWEGSHHKKIKERIESFLKE